ncbi:3beta-hydroxysteroid dehydrogenase isoform X2 [Lynx canadensis]|uniref:3beta-hydroxysteroid dehydrogenase isoform X2 n=1 Tax=Lynx canadensis TaxID=61383 RepID=UPI0011B0725D|nr:3beta-hydroxysteroid dehydrogenase isoform X2 [Lynx canadensis]
MSSHTRVALVTGANKGIGFAIVRDLCRQFSGDVVLTARDEARGQAAVQRLQAEGLSPRFHLLDIDDLQSIRALRDFLRKEYGGLDVLVNNAGIAFKTNDPTPFHIQAEVTMKTNFFGTRDVCTELLPLMKPQGRPAQARCRSLPIASRRPAHSHVPQMATGQWYISRQMRQLYCPSGLLSPGEAPTPLPLSRPAQAAYMHIFFNKHTYSTINICSFIYDFLNLFSTLLYCKNKSCMLIDYLCHGYAFSQNQTISKLLGKSKVNVHFSTAWGFSNS